MPYYSVQLHPHVIVALMVESEVILELTVKDTGIVLECISEHVESPEDPHGAAVRGVWEEAGIRVPRTNILGFRRITGGLIPIFAVKTSRPDHWEPPQHEDGEIIHLVRVPITCIKAVTQPPLGHPYIVDVTVDAALSYL